LLAYTRSLRNALLVVACSLVAVIAQLGLLQVLGQALDPYSVLVPFLIFAIGVSHGTQKMNGIAQDIGRGTHKLIAARYTFRRLFLPGVTALMTSAAGFAVLMLIDISAIRALALAATVGIVVLVFTNLVMLPILLSYVGVNPRAARRAREGDGAAQARWLIRLLGPFTRRRPASIALALTAVLAAGAFALSLRLQVGDLGAGAPELRPDSRYNRDNAFLTTSYSASSDVLVVMVETAPYQCADYDTVVRTDALVWNLQQLAGVRGTNSLADLVKRFAVGMNEGNPKWYDIPRDQQTLNAAAGRAPRELINYECSLQMLYVFLEDHKADTLSRVVTEVEAFAAGNDRPPLKFLLTAGNAGFAAATNVVVKRAEMQTIALVYVAVLGLCFVTFRSWRAVCCAALPLALTSIMCQALMVMLGIGVKVATLPVIAVGVGVGVDYTLYVLSVLLAGLRQGMSLDEAHRRTLLFTGKVVLLAGATLALAVSVWFFSPIKFQADMGVLLAFMFVWNMLGTLILVPAFAHFLLRVPRAQKVR
jgi:predicted RND superfamily exporter protein